MSDWQQYRNPEDIPTPLAIACADYCRRNQVPSTPKAVRAALALLPPDDDEKLKRLADDGALLPGCGPYALVDIVRGASVELALERQASGFYTALRVSQKAPQRGATQVVASTVPLFDESRLKAPVKRTRAQSISDKIKPKKRDRFEPEEILVQAKGINHTLSGASFLTKRNLPLPKGRFSQVDPSKLAADTLMKTEAKDMLVALVDQSLHRDELWRTLETGYTGKRGQALVVEDVLQVLEKHGLKKTLEEKERALILGGIVEHRGAVGRLAKDRNLSEASLKNLIVALKLKREVSEATERFTREALSHGNLSVRIELLFKTAYLNDLGIELKFKDRLKLELKNVIKEIKDDVSNPKDLVALLARKQSLSPEPLLKALEKLGLI
jgi:hypothetical protein